MVSRPYFVITHYPLLGAGGGVSKELTDLKKEKWNAYNAIVLLGRVQP